MYMVRIIRSGKVEEKVKFRVAPNVKPRSTRRRGGSTERKQDANERDRVKRLARTINCNFSNGDLLLNLTFDEESFKNLCDGLGKEKNNADPGLDPGLRDRAQHEGMLFLRRLKRELDKTGVTLKYILVASDMNGDTGEDARIHIHVIISGKGMRMEEGVLYAGARPMAELWPHGAVNYQPLRIQDDYTPLAAYLMRQVRRIPDARKYTVSRNLDKPVLVSEEIVMSAGEIKAPKGAKLLHRAAYEPGGAQYIRYVRPAAARRRRNDKC